MSKVINIKSKMEVYFQTSDEGKDEVAFYLTYPDPADGTICAHLPEGNSDVVIGAEDWIRICPPWWTTFYIWYVNVRLWVQGIN